MLRIEKSAPAAAAAIATAASSVFLYSRRRRLEKRGIEVASIERKNVRNNK